MFYLLPAATLAMLGYIAWVVIFRMRRERVLSQRERTRGKFTFLRPKERVRFLLNRSFKLPDNEPEWEGPVVTALKRVPASQASVPPEDEVARPQAEQPRADTGQIATTSSPSQTA